jgi:uncharacterized small protein (DUF1192 family)
MHRNALLYILADLEQRITFCEAELAYRRARLDRVGQATREATDAIAREQRKRRTGADVMSTLSPANSAARRGS